MWKVVYATDFSDYSLKVANVLLRYRDLIEEVLIVRVVNLNKILGAFVDQEEWIEREKEQSLEKLNELENFLKEILGIEVDLLTEKSISPLIKPYIKELVVL